MHLLNVDTLKLETFYDSHVPNYAILSHTWSKEEVTFSDMQDPSSQRTTGLAGFEKIFRTCEQGKTDGYQYVWIDTCCIDKSSSAELSEAINSMFRWYRDAHVCYAYLADVTKGELGQTFPNSRWFKRGWTLQELIAPKEVVFLDREWHQVGTKSQHAKWISGITGIDYVILSHRRYWESIEATLAQFCIAKRMS